MGGPTMSLWIVNDTPEALVMGKQSQSSMSHWAFTDVPPRLIKCFDVGFEEGWFHWESSDKGSVVYKVMGGSSFEIQGAWKSNPILTVNWGSVDSQKITVFPPDNQGDICSLGWSTGGTMVILVQDKASRRTTALRRLRHLHYPIVQGASTNTKRAGFWWNRSDASNLADEPNKPTRDRTLMPHGTWGKKWMEQYADIIGGLSLTQLTIPCSHGSGTYDFRSPFAQNHEKTQSASLYDQLVYGIRVLDLEIGQMEPGQYIISYGIFRTLSTLEDAFGEITKFMGETKQEIVVLDIQKFTVLQFKEKKFDYESLKKQMSELIKTYCISPSENQTLNELWKGTERLIVAMGLPPDVKPDAYMWPPVTHKQFNDAQTAQQLHDAIEAYFSQGVKEDGLWSISVLETSDYDHTPLANAQDLSPEIDNWFYGCSDWARNANIIASDFFAEFNHTVIAAVCANLIKGHGTINPKELNTMINVVNEADDQVDGDWLLVSTNKLSAKNGSNQIQRLRH